MPTRKTADTAETPVEAPPESTALATPTADQAPAEPDEPHAADAGGQPAPAGGVALIFDRIVGMAVEHVGLVEPGQLKRVPEDVAERLCAGDPPLFVRAAD